MTCISDPILRARLDGELSEAQRLEVEKHCHSCANCRGRAEAIAENYRQVQSILSALAPDEGKTPDARIAFARFRERRAGYPAALSSPERLSARRLVPAWGAAAAVGAIIALFAFTPARSFAERLLSLLRVQKITVVPLDFEAFNNSGDRGRLMRSLAQMTSDDVVFTLKPGEPQPAATAEQASRMAGFKVRLPGKKLENERIKVLDEQAFHMTVDRDRLQAVLDEAGRSDLQLPQTLDGATIAAHIPKVVLAQYGNCARRADRKEQSNEGTGCFDFVQSPSPTVSVPPELKMAQVAEVGLQLGGMSAEVARQFSQTVDWTSTLVLGIPQGTSYRTVDVDGVQGTVIERPGRSERGQGRYTILWVKSGILYGLSSSGDSADALTAIESLD